MHLVRDQMCCRLISILIQRSYLKTHEIGLTYVASSASVYQALVIPGDVYTDKALLSLTTMVVPAEGTILVCNPSILCACLNNSRLIEVYKR